MNALVTGMHRSGTSALTQVIADLGLDPSDAPSLHWKSEFNATGMWEVAQLSRLNEALLQLAGGSWVAPPRPDRLATVLRRSRRPARRDFDRIFRSGGPWVWKDPRTCLTLPLWREVLPQPMVVVISLRHPAAVAGSLARREAMDQEYAFLLWDRYMRALLTAAAGLRTVFVDYEELAAHPGDVISRFAPLFGADERTVAAASDAVREDLRHQTGTESDLPASTRELWDCLRALVGVHDRLEPPAIAPEPPAVQERFTAHGVGPSWGLRGYRFSVWRRRQWLRVRALVRLPV